MFERPITTAVLSDEELLDLMRDAGCAQVLIGLESPTAAALDGLETRKNWKRKRLDDYRFQIGHAAGNLAMVMDRLTDVMAALAQHTVHCRVNRGPRTGEPPRAASHPPAELAIDGAVPDVMDMVVAVRPVPSGTKARPGKEESWN